MKYFYIKTDSDDKLISIINDFQTQTEITRKLAYINRTSLEYFLNRNAKFKVMEFHYIITCDTLNRYFKKNLDDYIIDKRNNKINNVLS